MADVLYLIGWNQFVAVLLAAAVWLSCRTKMLGERPGFVMVCGCWCYSNW